MARVCVCRLVQWSDKNPAVIRRTEAVLVLRTRLPFWQITTGYGLNIDHMEFVCAGMITNRKWLYIS